MTTVASRPADRAELRHLAIQRTFRAHAVPTVVDAYNEAPLDACLRHLAPVLRPGAAVLDLGCGDGALTEAFASQGVTAYGTDLDVRRLALGRARAASNPNPAYLKSNVESLPFASGHLDAVISVSVLQYVDWRRVIHECRRILRPGGRAVFLENLRGHPLARAYRVVRRRAWAYPRFQTPRAHIAWDEAAGFRDAFPGAELTSYHLLTPFLMSPHALRSRRPDRFSGLERRSFDLLARLDGHLLRRWRRLSGAGWLFTALCTKAESRLEDS